MGRFTIILVVGFAIIAGGMKLNYNRIARTAEGISADKFTEITARGNAHSATELCLCALSLNHSWRTGFSNLALAEGTASADIIDSTSDASLGRDTVRIEATGICGTSQVAIEAIVALNAAVIPPTVGSGVSARCDVQTKGDMIIDGRNHDLDGNVIPNNGVKAIITTGTVSQIGSSTLGGTMDTGLDLAPVTSGYDPVIEENVWWPDFPNTPDLVMGGVDEGYPEGTLKSIAQSGYNGSQYVTNPDDLSFPLSGVTYVELPEGDTWNDMYLGISSGVLVVHNDTYDAKMKNLNEGTFTGIIIVDDMVHVHSDVIGYLFLMTPTPSEGNCIGNGYGKILFSREATLFGMGQTGVEGDHTEMLSYYE